MLDIDRRMELIDKIEEKRLKAVEVSAMDVLFTSCVEDYIDYNSKMPEDEYLEHLDKRRELQKRKEEHDIFVEDVKEVSFEATEGAQYRTRPFIYEALQQHIIYGTPLSKCKNINTKTARKYLEIAWELLAEKYL